MSDHQQHVASVSVFLIISVFALLVGLRLVIDYYQRSQAAFAKVERWDITIRDHLKWFANSDCFTYAVLENMQAFVANAKLHECHNAFDLHQRLWHERARQIGKVFRNLAGREMEEMSDIELKNYMIGLAIDRGGQSSEFSAAIQWMIGEISENKKKFAESEKVAKEAVAFIEGENQRLKAAVDEVNQLNARVNETAAELIKVQSILDAGKT